MVTELINKIESKLRQKDALELLPLMQKWTKYKAYRCGNMVGFGEYHYKYESGREGDFFVTGFSPGKQNITVYIIPGFTKYSELLAKLGKHKVGKSCLYINKLADIDLGILERLVRCSVEHMQAVYVCKDKSDDKC
jgi:hypothetical protein